MNYYNKLELPTEYETIKTNKKLEYINLPCAFDIETTSTYINNEKQAFMYVWAFGIGETVVYGRTWQEFLNLCNTLKQHFNLSEKRALIIYVHNLCFEFQFIKDLFNWLSVFAVDERKPLKALSDLGLEFRCSYILSGYNLSNTAKNLTSHKIKKLVGDLDYSLIRHHETKLTTKELDYLKNDVLIILYYIDEQIEQYKNIAKIPLTNTGRVREFVRNKCFYSNSNHNKTSIGKYSRYKTIMKDLTLEPEEYIQLKRAFMGGFTHANANYTNKLLKDVSSIDFTSSYPSVMLSERYPMGKGIKTESKDFNKYIKTHCVLFDARFTGLKAKFYSDNYLSEHKAIRLTNAIINNGRIFSCDELITTLTDIDYHIIKECYEWDIMHVNNVIRYARGYLPRPIILSVLELYQKKTELKDVQGYETEYLLSKGMLNSIYGMCVTDIVKDENTYSNSWIKKIVDINKEIEKYNNSKNRFLSYAWGVWVTAYARRNLWSGIFAINQDYVYSDTDSIKLLNIEKHKPYIEWYNTQITNKLKMMCKTLNIDESLLTPKTIKGIEKPIGVREYEGTYKRFKTLGAKRYMLEDNNNDLKITVAGLSKKNGLNHMLEICDYDNEKVFNMFNDDLYINKEHTGKMTHTYIDEHKQFKIKDYNGLEKSIITYGGVHLEKCDFTLSLSGEYKTFLDNLINGYIYEGVAYV